MKKSIRITSAVLAGVMFASSVPAITVSASVVSKPEATAENAKKGVKITWTKAKKAKKYVVMRKLSTATSYTAIRTVNSSKAGSIIDKNAKAGQTYNYKVRAYNGSYYTESDKQTIVRLKKPKVWMDSVEGIWVQAGGNLKGAKKVQVFRAEVKNGKTGKYIKVDTLDPKDEWDAFEDVETENAIFKFKVRTVSGKSKSAFSKAVKVDYIEKPWSYSDLREDKTGIDIKWGIIENVEGFRIYRSDNGANAELIADIKTENCVEYPEENPALPKYIYTDYTVEKGNLYTYYMESYDGKRCSDRDECFLPVEY